MSFTSRQSIQIFFLLFEHRVFVLNSHRPLLLKNKCLCLSVSHARVACRVLVCRRKAYLSVRCKTRMDVLGARGTCVREKKIMFVYMYIFYFADKQSTVAAAINQN